MSITLRTRSRSSYLPPRHDSAGDHTTTLGSFTKTSAAPPARQMHQDRRHTTSPTSLRAALPVINQIGHIGDLKLHSGALTRCLLPELCRKRSTRHPVGGAPLREPTPLQPQHSPLDVQGPLQKHSSMTRACSHDQCALGTAEHSDKGTQSISPELQWLLGRRCICQQQTGGRSATFRFARFLST